MPRLVFPAVARSVLAVTLCVFIGLPTNGLCASGQEPAVPAKLNIVILEGEGAINNIKQRTAREAIVQVEDENRRPIAGAAVLFMLPESGPSAPTSRAKRRSRRAQRPFTSRCMPIDAP